MNRLLEIWARIKTGFWALLTQIEESSLFERIVIRFEGLDPIQQRRLQLGGTSLAVLLTLGLFLYPLFSAIGSKWNNSRAQKMLDQVRTLNIAKNVERKAASQPPGWIPFNAASNDDFRTSLEQFLMKSGVSPELSEIEMSSQKLKLSAPSITIRQANAILFQFEASVPALTVEELKLSINGDNVNLVDLSMTARLDLNAASKLQGDASSPGNNGYNRVDSNSYNNGSSSQPRSAPLDIPRPEPLNNSNDQGPSADMLNQGRPEPPISPPTDYLGDDLPPPAPFEEEL